MNNKFDAYNARRKIEYKRTKERRRRRLVSPAFREQARREDRCRNPACSKRRSDYNKLHAHHIVHRSHFNPYDPEKDNPCNAMALCFECHGEYHNGRLRPERSWLREEELQFALKHAGEVWLDRVYPERE